MQSVGLLEAWGLWWQGKSVQSMSLWGIPVIVVGRVGKVMSFIGSIAAVIDLIGPERIREWGGRARSTRFGRLVKRADESENPFWGILAVVTLGFITAYLVMSGLVTIGPAGADSLASFGLGIAVIAVFCLIISPVLSVHAVSAVGHVLESGRGERVIRWVGFNLIVIGFSFDLLAS
jgi:hypothetical protein